jgi:hypothetical protein
VTALLPVERRAMSILFSEFDGAKFDYSTMSFKEQR